MNEFINLNDIKGIDLTVKENRIYVLLSLIKHRLKHSNEYKIVIENEQIVITSFKEDVFLLTDEIHTCVNVFDALTVVSHDGKYLIMRIFCI